MIWDKSFQSVFESGIEENWFPIQLLKAVDSIQIHSDDVQVEILKVLFQKNYPFVFRLFLTCVINYLLYLRNSN